MFCRDRRCWPKIRCGLLVRNKIFHNPLVCNKKSLHPVLKFFTHTIVFKREFATMAGGYGLKFSRYHVCNKNIHVLQIFMYYFYTYYVKMQRKTVPVPETTLNNKYCSLHCSQGPSLCKSITMAGGYGQRFSRYHVCNKIIHVLQIFMY